MAVDDPCPRNADNRDWPIAGFEPSAVVRVTVAELNLRAGPCTDATILGTFSRGALLIVDDSPFGPIRANGYRWYRVHKAPNVGPAPNELPALPGSPFPIGIDTAVGWVAVSNGEERYVEPESPRCPSTVDLANVVGMLPSERLACFHDEPIVLEGTYGCGGCGGTGGPIAEPAWLADPFEFEQIRTEWEAGEAHPRPVGIHFPPSGPTAPPEGSIVRVTVHVDDPAATRCTFVYSFEEPPFTTPEDTAVAWCRQRLVVDSVEVIGTDPDYPG